MIKALIEAEKVYNLALERCVNNAPDLFKETRKKLKVSQRGLARILGCDHTYISKIENGRLKPGKPILSKLGELMNKK